MILAILLQSSAATEVATDMNLFTLILKGGWIMLPLAIFLAMSVFIMSDSWVAIKKMLKYDPRWLARILELTAQQDVEKAYGMVRGNKTAVGRMVAAGLQSYYLSAKQIEEDMQVEVRQMLGKIESSVGYLNMIAKIAPMLGFLGTIFGVIRIFIQISTTNDFNISVIADGLYQKMICSGAGLLVGIIAYSAYYVLNRQVDKLVLVLDKVGNELIKAIGAGRSQAQAPRS